jgi:hypothetical protein
MYCPVHKVLGWGFRDSNLSFSIEVLKAWFMVWGVWLPVHL